MSVFFAYDVALYLFATRVLGWWTPSEALLHPDVLATYVPWLSAIANSLQAGFWEECLFRAVPLAGAALIGDRFGKRGLFLAIAFVVQAAIFGAGHAPYPTQPSYARPVELIIPSIGFGLLYVYFGLLPGIVLHFAFDVVWFALPIFLSDAPGIWFQKAMVVVMTLVPLWVVLWRRWQAGQWSPLSPTDRNAAWTPPAHAEPEIAAPAIVSRGLSPRSRNAWLAIGAVSLVACVWIAAGRRDGDMFTLTRTQAADIARTAVAAKGGTLGPQWRVMPVPDDGSGGPREFVSVTAGDERRRELLGKYLPEPRWNVRIATFEGDVAERAEEWRVFVTKAGQVLRVEHTLPEARPGASLDESSARALAVAALKREFGLDVAGGQAREVSARPRKLKARTDWTFTYADGSLPPLPRGELRIDVDLAGEEVASVRRFVFVPEEWERGQRATETRNFIIRIVVGIVFGGLLVSAAVAGVIAWSRKQYTPRLCFAVAGIMLVVSLASASNGWPSAQAQMPTEIPLPIQLLIALGGGLVAVVISSSLAGLAIGAQPTRLVGTGRLNDRDALLLGCAVGAFGAAVVAVATSLRTPAWAVVPWIAPVGSFIPTLSVLLEPLGGFLTRAAGTPQSARQRPSPHARVDATARTWRGGSCPCRLSWRRCSCRIADDGMGNSGRLTRNRTARRVRHGASRGFDDDPDRARDDCRDRRSRARSAAAVPRCTPGALVAAVLTALLAWWLFGALRRWRDVSGTPSGSGL